MAMHVRSIQIGIDVSKPELMVSVDGDTPTIVLNQPKAIRHWLRQFQRPVEIALESTSDFHFELANQAHQLGHKVFMINGHQLNCYRQGIGGRAKTDKSDAILLARYLRHERDALTAWEPPSAAYRQIQGLLRRRAILVQARVQLQQSLSTLTGINASFKALMRQFNKTDLQIQKQIVTLLKQVDWYQDALRCQAIEGIGPITSAMLALTFHRGRFKSSDAFIAFLGLDVRVKDSGRKVGRRCLTKQGDPEIRRLLFLAAMQAKRKPAWASYYQRFIDKGLAPIQALVVLARKLARVAFAIMQKQTQYIPKGACMPT